MSLFEGNLDDCVMKFRQLGQQLLEEPPTVLNQLGKEHLGQLRASLDAVKRRHGFESIAPISENYEAETESQSTSDSRSGSDSTGSHLNDLDEKEERMIELMRSRGRSMSMGDGAIGSFSALAGQSLGPLYGTKFNTARYKTEMCQRFEETGECKFQAKCQFAHGQSELRTISKHPKFKTVPCKTFHTSGVCAYGNRCNFLHAEKPEELENIRRKHQAVRRMSMPTVRAVPPSFERSWTSSRIESQDRLPVFRRLSLSD